MLNWFFSFLWFLSNLSFSRFLFIGIYFFHQFRSSLFLFNLLLVQLFNHFFTFLLFLILPMLRLSLSKVAIKLILARTFLNIILLIFFIFSVKITKISFMFCPKRVLLLLFFSIHQVVHFSASTLSKLHLFDRIVLWFNWSYATRLLTLVILIAISTSVLAITWSTRWLFFILLSFLFAGCIFT